MRVRVPPEAQGSTHRGSHSFGYQLSLHVESVSGVVGDDGQECGAPRWVEADDDAVALGEVEELGDIVDRVGGSSCLRVL